MWALATFVLVLVVLLVYVGVMDPVNSPSLKSTRLRPSEKEQRKDILQNYQNYWKNKEQCKEVAENKMFSKDTRVVPFPISGNAIGLLEAHERFSDSGSVVFVGNLISFDEVAEKQRNEEKSCYDLTKSISRKDCLVHNPTVSIKAAENFTNALALVRSDKKKFFVIPGENDLQYLFPEIKKFETSHKLKESFKRSKIELILPNEGDYNYTREDAFKCMYPTVYSNGYLISFGGITKKWIEAALPELTGVGFGIVPSVTLEKALHKLFLQRNPNSCLYMNENDVKSPFFVQNSSLKPEDYYSGISQIFYSPEADETKKLLIHSLSDKNITHFIAKMPRVLYAEGHSADAQYAGYDLKPTK